MWILLSVALTLPAYADGPPPLATDRGPDASATATQPAIRLTVPSLFRTHVTEAELESFCADLGLVLRTETSCQRPRDQPDTQTAELLDGWQLTSLSIGDEKLTRVMLKPMLPLSGGQAFVEDMKSANSSVEFETCRERGTRTCATQYLAQRVYNVEASEEPCTESTVAWKVRDGGRTLRVSVTGRDCNDRVSGSLHFSDSRGRDRLHTDDGPPPTMGEHEPPSY